jgi:hypothetical protein
MKKTSKISILPRSTVTPQATLRRPGGDSCVNSRDLVEEFYVVSARTGEEVGRYVFDGRVMPKPGDWVRLYQGFADELSKYPDQPIESRALWLVVAKAGFGNFARINVTEVALSWGVSRQSLSAAMSSLVSRKIIERAKGGNYRLNPNFIWKGGADARRALCERWAAKPAPKLADDVEDTATA